MKKSLLFRPAFALALILFASCARGQSQFDHTADLGGVQQEGFYKIPLHPSIVAKCREGLPDIRIMNGKDSQVPYILVGDQPSFTENRFTGLPIISVKKEKDKQTHLVIHNKPGKPVSELLLVIRNTAASRTVTISGSDDNSRWFIIEENIALDHFSNTDKDSFIQSLGFPKSSYRYFKIIINGEDLLPVNIIRAGIYEEQVYQGSFALLPVPAFDQKDSTDKSSYISLLFNDSYQIDKLELEFTGPKFYNRLLSVRRGNDRPAEITSHTIRSGEPVVFGVHAKTNRLNLKVLNEDNPSLKLSAVKAWQLNRWLLTYLEPANNYRLVFGDARAEAPNYDLAFFKNSIGEAGELKAGQVRRLEQAASVEPATPRTTLLWVIIAAVLALLLLLTMRMTRQVNRKENP